MRWGNTLLKTTRVLFMLFTTTHNTHTQACILIAFLAHLICAAVHQQHIDRSCCCRRSVKYYYYRYYLHTNVFISLFFRYLYFCIFVCECVWLLKSIEQYNYKHCSWSRRSHKVGCVSVCVGFHAKNIKLYG